jgi:DNA-binding transcriptional MerR regulator
VSSSSTATLTIQQMAARSGFSEHTLRYYEGIGLIGPVQRDESSRHRRYPLEVADRVEALACLRATGMSIVEMRGYLAGVARGNDAAGEMVGLFSEHADHLQRELAATRLRLAYVQAKVDLWQARVDADEPREQESKAVSRRLAERLRASITA